MKSILLLGRKTDPHIIGISDELKKLNENFIILDEFSPSDSFSISLDGTIDYSIKFDRTTIEKNTIKSVWNMSALKILQDDELIENSRNFILSEWTEGIKSLWNVIDAKWINSPDSMINSANRLKQLEIAKKLGLIIPKTLITNEKEKLCDFFHTCNQNIIAKTLNSSQGLPDEKMIFTTKIGKNELEKSDDLKYAPCMFQEYVKKKTELRITIVDEKIHAAEIFSQKSVKTKDDWRNYDDFQKTPYIKTTIPTDIEEKLLKIMKSFGLEFGAIDMIKTPNDNFVFLEINPNGRWWWIQELTEMNIAKDIAFHLSKSN